MKITNIDPPGDRALGSARGRNSTIKATSRGVRIVDRAGRDVEPVTTLRVPWVQELDDDEAELGSEVGQVYTNDSGGTLNVGDVVVIDGTTIITTTTAQDTRPVGVVIAAAEDGEDVVVQTSGRVDLVNVTASVTANNFAETSTTAGAATESVIRRVGSFGVFLTSGSSPSALLFGIPDSAGSGTGGAETPFDHGNMGATETIDLADGTWHRGTLNANCTITVQGFTADEAVVAVFECSQDGTGGWDITWDSDVTFIGDDQPDPTASTTTVFLLFTSQGDTAIYGAKVGGGGSTSPLTTKGDLYGYDTAAARIPVGADTYLLVSDSTDAQGIVWKDPSTTGHWEVLMDGAGNPLDNGSGTDWLYVWVP